MIAVSTLWWRFMGRNCVRRAKRRMGYRAVRAIQKRGFHALPTTEIYITYWEKYKTIHYRGFIRKLIPLRFTCDENKMQIGAKTLNTQPSTSLMLMNLSPEHDMKMFFAPLHMDERGQLLQCDRQEFKSESRIFWTQNSDSMDSQIRANLRQSIAN